MFYLKSSSGKATDEQTTEPDWMGMMAMCDLVRQQEVRNMQKPNLMLLISDISDYTIISSVQYSETNVQ